MKKLLFYLLPIGLILTIIAGVNQNLSYSRQIASVKSTTQSTTNGATVRTSIDSRQDSKQDSKQIAKSNLDREVYADGVYEDRDDEGNEISEEDFKDGNNVNSFTSFSSQTQISSDSGDIQRNSLSIDAASLRQPQILKINSSNANVRGEIKINGKVVRRLNSKRSEINLSPYLSRGKQKVEVSARYSPATASVSVEMKSSNNDISQQSSGSGTLNYTLDLDVR